MTPDDVNLDISDVLKVQLTTQSSASKSKSLILPKSGSNNSLNSLTVSRERSPHRKKSPSRTKVKSTIAKSASKESLDDLDRYSFSSAKPAFVISLSLF